ncbi:MAG: NfeD family protein [Gammaproteobacteria bacterium]
MIVEYIHNHQAEFWIIFGFTLLVLEVVTGFTTGVFLFGGLGGLITGLLMLVGILPETWTAGVASAGISSGIITALLWKALRKLQGGTGPEKDNSSDLIGYEFVIEQDVGLLNPGSKRYSGIVWRVEIAKDAGVKEINAGQRVAVNSVDVGVFWVKPV